ncbi:glycosyltransferase [Pectinatus cerevisiiphilus]|uniref:Glycosyltransferase involved in cell wall biosynthesis n=1 Tax=Pectinatus cerevisiiphilus TaxID=86956 RepID=A0A4R3KCM5_9FIRM|nr:glycosyltransferase [Pectinatus cerevisiiphilus]TCS80835.1 glycosyltransferase involved in cell wall biosynthesis [Pectinatus cerevisiiphilus]
MTKKFLNIVSGTPSGALNISMAISNYLKKQGYNVIDVFRKYNKTELTDVIVIKDKFTLDYIWSLAKFIQTTHPDIILVHGYSTHIWTKLALAYAKMDVKLIHVEHNIEKYTAFRSYLTRKMDKYTAKYICVSQGVATNLAKQGINKDKIEVIYNGIDIDKFNLPKIPHKIFTVGMVARFSKQKDQLTLIKAIEYLLKEKNIPIKLILMGAGKTKEKCISYVRERQLANNISFTEGKFADLIGHLDIFILSTHYEGLALVLCEAMAAKTPVIASNVNGTDAVIDDKYNGLLFTEGNYQELSDCILNVKNNKSFSDQLVSNGYSVVNNNFSLAKMLKLYLKNIE